MEIKRDKFLLKLMIFIGNICHKQKLSVPTLSNLFHISLHSLCPNLPQTFQEHYANSLSLMPSARAHFGRGTCLAALRRRLEAMAELEKAKELLGGGNSNIFYFHPDPWGNDPI